MEFPFNEFGQVVCWRLTKTQTFAEIEDILFQLKERQEKKGQKMTAVCVDNCCLVKNKYNSIFEGVHVKLDLFHAIQRLTQSASSDHLQYHDMIQAFSLIFREDDDQGKELYKETPKRKVIERNLNTFIERWHDSPAARLPLKPLLK